VLLRAYNQPDALLAWLALLQCGARVLPLNPQLPPSAGGTAAVPGSAHALVLKTATFRGALP
jgi:O-succinylbenzoic acid--CoA ligase